MSKKEVQIKNWITILGIVFQKDDKTKCDLELKNEELLLQTLILPINDKSL